MYEEMKSVIEACFWHDENYMNRWNNFQEELKKYPQGMVDHIYSELREIYDSLEFQMLYKIWTQQGARPEAWKLEIMLDGFTLPEHKKLRATMAKPRRKVLALFEKIDFAVNVVGLPRKKENA